MNNGNSDIPVEKIASSYPYKTAEEHYNAGLAETKKVGHAVTILNFSKRLDDPVMRHTYVECRVASTIVNGPTADRCS